MTGTVDWYRKTKGQTQNSDGDDNFVRMTSDERIARLSLTPAERKQQDEQEAQAAAQEENNQIISEIEACEENMRVSALRAGNDPSNTEAEREDYCRYHVSGQYTLRAMCKLYPNDSACR